MPTLNRKILVYFGIFFLSLLLATCLFKQQVHSFVSFARDRPFLAFQSNNEGREVNFKKNFPNDLDWIDVKKDFGAKGDGITDDTIAIKKAIKAPYGDYTRPKILYFPAGTYLVTDSLQLQEGQYACCVTFQGQGREETIIKLKNNSVSFSNKNQPKAVIRTNEGNAAFRNFFRDLSVNTGSNNPGAIGIDYISNNRGGIINVSIKSEDGQGTTGLSMIRQWPGPSLIKNVAIEGFDYGIHTRHPEYGIVFEYIELKNQNIVGILNEGNTLAIRAIESLNSVPVINNQSGLVITLEGEFQGGAANSRAILNKGYLYARNIKVKGYQAAIENNTKLIAESSIKEYISHPVYSLFKSPNKSLNLPIEETPYYYDNDLNNWANVKNYPTIQAAMNSGKSTIYFPMGQYQVNEEIEVPATVKKIVGFESFINLNQKDLQATIFITEDSKEPLIIENLWFNNTVIDRMSRRTLALKHTAFGNTNQIKNNSISGKLFLEDVQMNLQINKNQQVWARQLNSETLFEGKTKVTNSGGNLWILGLKTEGKGTAIETTDGGKTELLGTLIYPVEEFNESEQGQAAFINHDSSHSLIYSVSAYGAKRNYNIQVEETRNGETKTFSSKEIPELKIPLFVGY
jgi:hypothetical protein